MFYPSEQNGEYIEVFNNSNSTINIHNLKLKYYTSSPDNIIPFSSDSILKPQQYGVIFEADYDFNTGIYSSYFSDSTLILILDDNAFGSRGMSNTSDRIIYLHDSDNDTLDSYIYSANNNKGFSDERVDINKSNWENSITLNGSPGIRNTVSKRLYDLSINDFFSSIESVIVGETVIIKVIIKNKGSEIANDIRLNLFIDDNKDSIQTLDELVDFREYAALDPEDSITVIFNVLTESIGKNVFISEIIFDDDEFLDNNIAFLDMYVSDIIKDKVDLIINEVMFNPSQNEPEWIEIYNRSEEEINVYNYTLTDATNSFSKIDKDYNFYPKSYLVIADDSTFYEKYPNVENVIIKSFPALNNSGDEIIIKDSLLRTIDSLKYYSDWGTENGKSIERINPIISTNNYQNWVESVFPTPGSINSVTQKEFDIKIDSVYTDPEFPLIGDTFHFQILIKNIGKNFLEYSVELYLDENGDKKADILLEKSELLELHSEQLFLYESLYKAVVEQSEIEYIIRLTAKDEDTTNNIYNFTLRPSYAKNSIIINEVLVRPVNDEPEWIELYNNSNYDVDIGDWEISDILTNPTSTKITDEYIFPSKSYLLISKNKSVYNYHRIIPSKVIECNFANLNNDEDGIVLFDKNGRTIDSVRYNSDWNLVNGNSIERINSLHSSNNKNNWNNSIYIEGSTPGHINSITTKDYDIAVVSLISIPKFPIKGDEIAILAKIKNLGVENAEDFKIEFFLENSFEKTKFDEINNLNISAGDSLLITTKNKIEIEDSLIITCTITFEIDEDNFNNSITKLLVSGFNKKSVLISELMFKPILGMPEWIEIYNNSDSTISLKNWLIGDSKSKSLITEDIINISPEEYVILIDSKNSSSLEPDVTNIIVDLPELGNTKDDIILYDYRDAIIDSMFYVVEKNIPNGISLERIDTGIESINIFNWDYSLDYSGSTPGYDNSLTLIPQYSYHDVVITEIMYNPSEKNCEFIEIYNNSENEIEIGGWNLDINNDQKHDVSRRSFILKPNNYFTISADSTILKNFNWLSNNNISFTNSSSLGLLNDISAITILDIRNNIIDSVNYSSTWHNSAFEETKNVSLELINLKQSSNNSNNWSSSVSEFGGTPGMENSINMINEISKSKLDITPNPFSPDGDGFEDFTFFNYNLTQPVTQIRIRIYDSKGRFIKSIANNKLVGSQGTIIYNGLDRFNKKLKVGIYIALFEAINERNNVVDVIKEVFVIGKKF